MTVTERQGLYVGDFVSVHQYCDGHGSHSRVKLCSEEDWSAFGEWLHDVHGLQTVKQLVQIQKDTYLDFAEQNI